MLEAKQAVAETQEAFEIIMEQTARTTFKDDLHVRLAMSALICAWQCVCRARAAAPSKAQLSLVQLSREQQDEEGIVGD